MNDARFGCLTSAAAGGLLCNGSRTTKNIRWVECAGITFEKFGTFIAIGIAVFAWAFIERVHNLCAGSIETNGRIKCFRRFTTIDFEYTAFDLLRCITVGRDIDFVHACCDVFTFNLASRAAR